MEHVSWLKDFLVFLAAAGIAVPLLVRLRVGAVLGFLLIGIVIGPSGLGRLAADTPWLSYFTIDDVQRVAPFAELGVMFLLFLIGLELSLTRLAAMWRQVLGIGGAQFVGCSVAIGVVAFAAGAPPAVAALLGAALAMSSTAIVMQLIEDQGRTATPIGRLALAVLLFQDLMVAPLLFLTGFLAQDSEPAWSTFGISMLLAVALIGIILGAGRIILEPVLRFAAQTGSRELIMAITLLIVIGLASLTARLGLSAALGAFLAGLALSKTEYRHQIEIDLAPFKGLLLGLFFISVGTSVDLVAAGSHLHWLLAAALLLIAVKAVVLFVASRLLGAAAGLAAEASLLLAQAGEFGLVVITIAGARALLDPASAQFVTQLVVLSMIVTPLLAFAARGAGRALQHRGDSRRMPQPREEALDDHVVIGGFGRVGQAIAQILQAENVPYVALDANAGRVTESSRAGCKVYFGDASRAEFLRRAGAAQARAFVITLDDPEAAVRMMQAISELRPDAAVFARAASIDHAKALLAQGAQDVIPETVEASLQLAARLLEALGLSDEAVAHRIGQMRDTELRRLRPEG